MNPRLSFLKNLRIGELSVVRRPANPGADAVLFKSDEEPDSRTFLQKFLDLVTPVDKNDASGELGDLDDGLGSSSLALHASVASILDDDALSPLAKQVALDNSLGQYREALISTFPILKAEPTMATDNAVKKDDLGTDAETDVDKKAKKPADEGQDEKDKLAKSAEIQKAEEAVAKAEKDAADARSQLADFKKSAEEKDRLTIAKGLVDGTTTVAEGVAELLGKLDDAGQTTLKSILTQNQTLAKSAKALEEIGKKDDSFPEAMDEVKKSAAEFQKSDSTLTSEQAVAKALRANPKLYEASLSTPATE